MRRYTNGAFFIPGDMDIKKWIDEDGAFIDGLRLYQDNGGRKELGYFLQVAKMKVLPAGAKNKLRSQLLLIAQDLTAHIATQSPASPRAPQPVEPQVIQSLRIRGRNLLKKRDHLRAKLIVMTEEHERYSNEDRYVIILELMEDITPQVDEVYGHIRRWQESGELPPENDTNSIKREAVAQYKRLLTVRPQLTRYRKQLKENLTDKQRQGVEKKLLDLELEQEQLQKDLGLE